MENNQPNQPEIVIQKKKKGFPLGGLIVLVVGIIWLLNGLGVSWATGVLVPAVVIVIGLALIIRRG